MTTRPANSFDAKHLSTTARKICKREGLTPRWFIPVNNGKPSVLLNHDDPDYDVMIVGNSKRQITITAADMFYQVQRDS